VPPTDTETVVSPDQSTAAASAGGASPDDPRPRAAALYAANCAGCHGDRGDGVSIASRFLFPKPRDFRAGRFRLISTANGVPTLSDLENVLVRGMPGSSMPPWPHLSEEDRRLLAGQVLEFRREGIRDKERAAAKDAGDEADPEEIESTVLAMTTPEDPIEAPELEPASDESIQRGRNLFLTIGCAACHGQEGRGDGQQKMIDEEGLPTRPRDLTRGLFKGNPQPRSIYRLFLAGMPGTPMPALRRNTPRELSDLAHFVLSLSDEKTRAGAVLNRERISVHRVPALPDSPDAAPWNDVEPAHLRTAPVWWRDEFPNSIAVRALHDGESIALLLNWADAVPDQITGKTESFRDAAAVELFSGPIEPFLGMGSPAAPIDAWLWSAGRDVPHDLEDVNPNVIVDQYPFSEPLVETAEFHRPGTRTARQNPLSLSALSVGNQNVPGSSARYGGALVAAGPGTVTFRPAINQSVETAGQWKAGRWSVVLKRALATGTPAQGLPLKAGQRVSAAFAVWDGAHRDRGPQKVITIWQDLVLE
jgi:mono/diheme cytochrome c family protein